jgi:hypothetical protein
MQQKSDPAQINFIFNRVIGGSAMQNALLTDLEFPLEAFFYHILDTETEWRNVNLF